MIVLKSDSEIDAIRAAGRLAAEGLAMIREHVKPGITTLELNDICHAFFEKHGARNAPLNYKGFPKSVCTSVNEVVCHGIPSASLKLKEGDIINIDVTPVLNGFYGDSSETFFVGKVSDRARRVTECAKRCLELGIEAVKVGGRIGDIGAAIQGYAERQGFSVVRDFVGHGIGRVFHEDPQVPHYGTAGRGLRIEAGMVFTIEPMINEGSYKTVVLKDGWTAITADKKLSAQFEHTIGIRSNGKVEILTAP